jgi:hypothetical protein
MTSWMAEGSEVPNPRSDLPILNRRIGLGVFSLFSVLILSCALWAQGSQGAAPSAPQEKSGQSVGVEAGGPQGHKGAETEHKISPKEAKELFRSVDDILSFASKDTSLPIHESVKRRLTSRDEVVAYIEKHMAEDEDAQRLRRSERVLKKFGMLPRDFDLQKFLIALLREQVAGYYDPKTKTVNLLDWIDGEQQKPVLAHELTHALQDQSFGLEKWMKAGDTDLSKVEHITAADLEADEAIEARQAIVEGQAMVVLIDYSLAPTGQTMLDSPQVVEALKAGMLVGTADSIQFQDAPIFMKESLTFPYRYGLDFEAELLSKGGKDKAYAGAFSNPPVNTRQIMEPKTYLAHEHLEPMRVPDFARDFKNYERFDVGAFGEFDVALLIDQYAGVDASKALYPQWRGGYYYAAQPKGDSSAPLGLLYVSRWSSTSKAAEFAATYANYLPKRYKHSREAPGSDKSTSVASEEGSLRGEHTWLTEEGPVVIRVDGDTVMITESFDEATTDQVMQELFPKAAAVGK